MFDKRTRVELLSKDLHMGIRGSGRECPLALATRRSLGVVYGGISEYDVRVNVVERRITATDSLGRMRTAKLTKEMLRFVKWFDSGGKVGSPNVFDVEWNR